MKTEKRKACSKFSLFPISLYFIQFVFKAVLMTLNVRSYQSEDLTSLHFWWF